MARSGLVAAILSGSSAATHRGRHVVAPGSVTDQQRHDARPRCTMASRPRKFGVTAVSELVNVGPIILKLEVAKHRRERGPDEANDGRYQRRRCSASISPQGDRLEIGVDLGGEPGIDRHEMVLIADLHGMTRIEKSATSASASRLVNSRMLRSMRAVEIEADGHVEPEAPQGGGQILGIVARIGQDAGCICIARVADHECDPFLGSSRPRPERQTAARRRQRRKS